MADFGPMFQLDAADRKAWAEMARWRPMKGSAGRPVVIVVSAAAGAGTLPCGVCPFTSGDEAMRLN